MGTLTGADRRGPAASRTRALAVPVRRLASGKVPCLEQAPPPSGFPPLTVSDRLKEECRVAEDLESTRQHRET